MSDITNNYSVHGYDFGIAVEVVEDSLDRVSKVLAGVPHGMEKAVGSAMKRAGKSGQTAVKKKIAEEYYISSGQFLKHTQTISRVREGGGGVSVQFGYRGAVIPLIEFHYRADRNGYISASVKRSGGGEIRKAFITTVNGHTGIFERESPARFPIHELFGPSTPQMMYSNEAITDEVEEKVVETYEKRIEHEIDRLLAGW